jgi:hypothetical protein
MAKLAPPGQPSDDNWEASWARTARYAVIVLARRLPAAIATIVGGWLAGHR